MAKLEIETTLKLAEQYLRPVYDPKAVGGLKWQVDAEEGNLEQAIAALAKQDQDVLKVWRIVKKKRT